MSGDASSSPLRATPRLATATANDVKALASIEALAFPAGQSWSHRQLSGALSLPGVHLVARSHDGVQAYALFQAVADEAELLRIAVDPPARRGGLAAALLRHGLAEVAAGGARRCFLEVRQDNAGARALYQQHGFAIVGRRSGYYRDGIDALLCALPLPQSTADVDASPTLS